MTITEAKARTLAANYYDHGKAVHFNYDGERITAFPFRRDVLNKLLETEKTRLFLMLVLSQDPRDTSIEYLNLVIGPRDGNNLLMDKLIISKNPPYTSPVNFVEASEKRFDLVISPEELTRMHNIYLNTATDNILTSTHGHKIKGYTVSKDDLTVLALREDVNNDNEDDLFLFIPVVRPVKPQTDSPFDREYLSLAIARLGRNGNVVSYITEYCLPCPNACPENFNSNEKH